MISKLRNGLPVIMDSMPHADSVVISVWVKTGGAMESESEYGLAHFLEHMAFKGTGRRSAFDIARQFDEIGGAFNAYTGKESTVYYAKSLSSDFEISCDILADVLMNSEFDKAEMESEREVVLQEIARTNDEAEDLVNDKFFEVAYPNQAFGRSILGDPERVMGFSREDLNSFVNRYYKADNMFVVVAGHGDRSELLEIVADKFGGLQRTDSSVVYSGGCYKGGIYREDRKLEQLHIVLGLEGIKHTDADYYVFIMLASILGGGMSSRLFQEIREKHGLAYAIGSSSSFFEHTGFLSISTGISPELSKVQKFFAICGEQLRDMSVNLGVAELDKVKRKARAHLLMKDDCSVSRAELAGSSYRYFGKALTKESILEGIEAVTVDAVRRASAVLVNSIPGCACAVIGGSDSELSMQKVVQFMG